LKKAEEVMEILEAYDLTGSLRAAAKLAGCDHKTVAHWVSQRELAAGTVAVAERRRPAMGGLFRAKIDELIEGSGGNIRADVAHDKLVAIGYEGSDRTTRRWVADAKQQWRRDHGRRTRPWIPEPGLWMQFDYGDGPVIDGRKVVLFCAWLAWSRYRVVVPLWDKTMPSVVGTPSPLCPGPVTSAHRLNLPAHADVSRECPELCNSEGWPPSLRNTQSLVETAKVLQNSIF
jgi:hypothetical protein